MSGIFFAPAWVQPPTAHQGDRSVRVPFLCVICGLIACCSAGCVSNSTYQRKTDEADHYAAQAKNLENDYAKLTEQQRQLALRYDELSRSLKDSQAANENLRQEKLRAAADIERLEGILAQHRDDADRKIEALRQTIARLEQGKQDLNARLEQEQLARQARIAQLKTTYDELVDKMEEEIARGEITISDLQDRLTVNLVEKVLFDSGKAELKPAGRKVLSRIGAILKQAADKNIRVEGHTDNIRISRRLRKTFPSNWELSTARAASVVHFLQDNLRIPGKRLSVCGFGPYQPIAKNTHAAGRAQNRRIQIVLVPATAGQPPAR